jgi:hypothetical protein
MLAGLLINKSGNDQVCEGLFGGANRNRTDDLLNAIQALSQLSYGPTSGSQPAPFPAKRSARVGTPRR